MKPDGNLKKKYRDNSNDYGMDKKKACSYCQGQLRDWDIKQSEP